MKLLLLLVAISCLAGCNFKGFFNGNGGNQPPTEKTHG
jgi:hypothetical protein